MILPGHKKKLQISIKKAAGSLKMISQMIEDEKYCLDIIQQINAASGLLRQAKLAILESHLQTCGADELGSKDLKKREKFSKELVQILDISSRR